MNYKLLHLNFLFAVYIVVVERSVKILGFFVKKNCYIRNENAGMSNDK